MECSKEIAGKELGNGAKWNDRQTVERHVKDVVGNPQK
jgi:hypothetical protein